MASSTDSSHSMGSLLQRMAKYFEEAQLNVLGEKPIIELCTELRKLLLKEPNVIFVSRPAVVLGDILGRYDIVNTLGSPILEAFGRATRPHQAHQQLENDVSFVFLGNYTADCAEPLRNRLKCILLRGNQDCRRKTKGNGFYAECLKIYGSAKIYDAIMAVFDAFPIAAIIDGGILCIHSGLSKELVSLHQLERINRCKETPERGILSDILWTTPDRTGTYTGWNFLDPPGTFGESIVEEFLKANNLVGIVRASQAWPSTQSPFLYKNRLATVWAAPMHKDTKARGLALLFRENEKQADGFTDDQIHDLNKEQR